MSQAVGFFSNIGVGTKQTSTSGAAIGAVPNSSTLAGDLVILGAYVVGADCTRAKDAGDGWVILDAGYDSVNGYGILAAACISAMNGAWTGAGLTLPGNAAFTSQTYTWRMASASVARSAAACWSLVGAMGSQNGAGGWFNATASSTTLTVPRRDGPGYNQSMEFAVCGYTNDGGNPVETVTGSGSWTERVDDGQNSPAHGLWIAQRNVLTHSSPFDASADMTISAACTNRAGVRCSIPVVGNLNASAMRQRHMSARRFG